MLRRYWLALALLLVWATPVGADTKISAYPSASALGGTELLLCDQSLVTSTCTPTQLLTFIESGALTQIGLLTPKAGIAAAYNTNGQLTVSPRLMATCGGGANTTGTSTANAATGDTYVSELYVDANTSTTGAWVYNFATQNGNDELYLADSAGNQILHTASTASSGGSAGQTIAWRAGATTIVGPGTYFLYYQNSGSTNTIGMWAAPGVCGTVLHTGGTYGTFPAITPPTTFTTLQGPVGGLY